MALVADGEIAALRRAAAAAPGPLSALAAAIATYAARALARRRLAWAMFAEPVEPEIDAIRLRYRRALAAEIEERLRAAIAAGHLPDQDGARIAAAIVGALVEALVGPLAAEDRGDPAATRAAVQLLTLFALRAAGVLDARARGLVVQTALPPLEGKR
jgi:hypothetical protein